MTTLSRFLRPVVALALCFSLATPAFAATAPVGGLPDPSTAPQLLDVQLSESAITVSGLGVHDVNIRLHLTSPVGVADGPGDPALSDTPAAYFTRTSVGRGNGGVTVGKFLLTSGTAEDGWWEAVAAVTAGTDGTLTVARVYAQSTHGEYLVVDPRTLGIDAHLQVTGSHAAAFTIHQTPDPVATGHAVTFFGTVTDLDTGAPFAGVSAGANFDTGCLDSGTGGALTSASGSWRQVYAKWNYADLLSCAGAGGLSPTGSGFVIYAYADDGHWGGFTPDFREWVTARAATATVRVGGTVTVTGQSSALVKRVVLQRIVGRSWRTVGAATTRQSGRFMLVAQPPARGTYHYRVLRPGTRYHEFPATSAPFVLVAR
ncbi:MAG: hypothetical protein QOG52_242 [Frankiaceae bacterium]|nr:hypothetical protein [Frankiaceae bacterium]